MPVKDDSLIAQYIRAIENPDSVGFNNGKWEAPPKEKGYDINNRGFGVDIMRNGQAHSITNDRPGRWLSEDEERYLREAHLNYVEDTLDKWTPKILREIPSEEKEAMALGMMYRGDNVKKIINDSSLRDAYYSGSNEDMQKAVSDFYRRNNLSERAANHNQFFNSKKVQKSKDTPLVFRKSDKWSPVKFENRQFVPKHKLFSDGGELYDNAWDSLSMKDKAEMMKVAIANGITTLPDIRQAYNEYAIGGNMYGNGGSKVPHDAKYNHAVTLYQGYIDRGMTPQTALELTNQKIAEKGWTGWASGDNKKFSTPDAFMDHTVDFHERMYPDSLNVNNFTQFFNGLEEGKHKYNPAPAVYKRNLLMTRPGVKKRINEYRATQGQAPLALLYPEQTEAPFNYDIMTPTYIEPLMEQPNMASDGGMLYAHGGYKPSASIKKRIADWEGASMKTNRSFEAEANDFNRVIPAEVRSKLTTDQLDGLYSYGYNVGMGNLKERVLPTLTAYTQGKATKEDVQRSMWAAKDNQLRGLTTRRNAERALFGGNYRTKFTGDGTLGSHIDLPQYLIPQETFDNINSMINNPSIPQMQYPDSTNVDPATIYKPPVIDETLFANPKAQEVPVYNPRQDRLEGLRNFNTVMGMLGQSSPFSGIVDSDTPGLLSYINQIYNT